MSKLLLIDDEEGIRKVLALSLASDGYEVLTAAGGEDGIEIFRHELPSIVLTDIKMPGIDGINILKQIKELNPDTEVIMITGHGDMDLAIKALKLNASDFLNKPIKDEILVVALKRAEERIAINQKLKAYTEDLENMVKIATEEVKRRAEFQNMLITSSNDAIIATDERGDIVIYNSGAERIFGYPRADVIRKMNIAELFPEEIALRFRSGLGGRKVHMSNWKEIDVVSKDGQGVPTRFSGSILHEQGKVVGSVAFFQDLREIKRLQEELITSERLAATGQTVAGLAHYIKNILNGLKGGTYVLNVALDKNDTDKIKNGWAMIERNLARTTDLVFDLLAYSKEREPEPENCFPNEIVKEVCSLMESRAGENGIEIERDLDPRIGEVFIDPKTLHRSLLNLVSNAIDACVYDPSPKKRWRVKVSSAIEEDHHRMRFDVADNGVGMETQTKERLFSSLFSTKGERGTGLGLLVTEKIVKENGGRIEVETSPGKGATFSIYLPFQGAHGGQ